MHYFTWMEIESISHKALRQFVETGKPKGLPGAIAGRLLKMVSFIIDAADFDELASPPNYGLHPLKGDRAGVWAMTVTKNWRLTFTKIDDSTVADMDLEDYH